MSVLIGLVNISLSATTSKYSRVTGGTFFRTAPIGAALIKVEGEIHSGHSTFESTGSESILQKLRDIEQNPNIKGILIEINSPGGTVGASQEVYNELMRLRKTRKIVVSMKDMAASGGYYIASSADKIFALSGTITGSIGVIAMAPNIKGLLDRYGVKMRTYKEGKYKDSLSLFRDSTPEEDEMIQKMLSDTYNEFIQDVAKGRIYSGQDAFRNKLVDEIGGRKEALEELSRLCQYDGEIPLYEEEESPFDRLFMMLGSKMNSFSTERIFFREFKNSPVLVILPQAIR
ncbi:signal peptide peptidase SppA, 36K type [Leptospira santarosai serovar Shermani str. 1342KT]|nr:signal peptide peptidase SppA, 36K type [Leptospira santarosai serovar Shermani str. 1342KT]